MAIKNVNYFDKEFNINYEIVNNTKDDIIVFLHGWGSNKEVMKKAFTSHLKEYKHIYIDMPGFGKSTNEYVLTTKDYANIMQIFLNELLPKNSIDSLIIAGHSFGGKVATYLEPKTLVLLSTAGILEEKSFKTKLQIKLAKLFNKTGLKKVTKFLRSKDVENMSQNMYETFKNVVDEDFSQVFENYTKNTIILWGESDTATSLHAGETIHKLIKNSKFKSFVGNHYFFLDNDDLVARDLEKFLRDTQV